MRAGVAMDRIRTEMEERIQSRAASAGDVPISPDGREALRRAAEEADRLGHRAIQTPHLLLGLLGDEGTPAGSVLAANGMGLEKARTDVAEVLGDAEA
jgi:ATP-dependent Clp protease ATP-binding subunit ClpA